VLFSTGEMPATSFTQDGGTRARCIEIPGMPFRTANQGALVGALNIAVKANYGHAGPAFVSWLMRERGRNGWAELAEEFRGCIGGFSGSIPRGVRVDRAVVDRLAYYFAAIRLAALGAHLALDLPWQIDDSLYGIWEEVVRSSSEVAVEERALRDIVSWANSSAESFWGRAGSMGGATRIPTGGWLGRWDAADDWDVLAIYSHILDQTLVKFGYQPTAVRAGWKERGWLKTGKGRDTFQVRIGIQRPFLVAITRQAVEEVGAC
jgi:hypothetical protein